MRGAFLGHKNTLDQRSLAQSNQPLLTSASRRSAKVMRPSIVTAANRNSVVVADIGGTNCRFQLWELDDQLHPTRLANEQFLPTKDYHRFDQALEAFLETAPAAGNCSIPKAAAFACAGPVKHGRCVMTNLGWTVDAIEVQSKFNIRSEVLNDFEAVGYGIPTLTSKDILVLNDVPKEDKGPIAVLGPGTGLGEAQLFWDDTRHGYLVHPSEGSHATFAPRGDKQRALQAHVEAMLEHCSVERVACGSGLVLIYKFLAKEYGAAHPGWTPPPNDPTPAQVSNSALDGSDPVAVDALDMMLAIVGAEAGHMALRALTTGGVYICGGIFPKTIERVKKGGVLKAFLWKESRFYEKVLKDIPLYVVMEEKVGLIGTREAAIRALQIIKDDVYIST